MSNTSVEVSGEGLGSVKDFFVNNWKKILAGAMVVGGLALAAPKALASDYNPGNQQEPVQAGQVMKDDTTYEYFELISKAGADNGFEEEGGWEGEIISGNLSRLVMYCSHSSFSEPFKGEFFTDMKASDDSGRKAAVQIELNLFSEDTLKFGELDSLLYVFKGGSKNASTNEYLNLRVDITTENGDTLTYAYGQDMESSERRKVRNVEGNFQYKTWYEQKFQEDLKEFVKESGLENEKIKSLRFYVENVPGITSANIAELDEVYLHATRMIITGIEENPIQRTQRPGELGDVILKNSNLYQATFPERGTLTIYEASTGRRVQAPIQVHGHVDVDFSGFPAGVYFGVYKPQEGKHQVGKIIKTQ